MMDLLSLDLVIKHFICDTLVLTIGYDVQNLKSNYYGEITKDYYGRKIPKHAHGTIKLDHATSSSKTLTEYIVKLYEEIVNPSLSIRRVNITACNLVSEEFRHKKKVAQINLFANQEKLMEEEQKKREREEKDLDVQKAIINIKNKYGKNAIIKGMDLMKGATTIERNNEIGGHKA